MPDPRLMKIEDLEDLDDEVKREIRDEFPLMNEVNSWLWNERNAAQDRHRSSGWYSPSSLPYCARSMFYQRTGVEQIACLEPSTHITFGVGHAVHDMIQKWMLEAVGEDALQVEVPCMDEELHTRGSADGLFHLSFLRRVLEIKTISQKGFDGLTKPMAEHMMQAHCYAYMLDAPVIEFVYVNKGWSPGGPIKTYMVLFDRIVWGKARDKLEMVEACVEAGNPPPQEISQKCWECRFKWHCDPELG